MGDFGCARIFVFRACLRVYVCTCVPGYDVKSKKIEMNWSEKINDQQNLNNAT